MKKLLFFIVCIVYILPIMAQQHNTGKITAVENGKIYIGIGEGHTYPGDRYIVVTSNEYFTHPVTGALIPRNENPNVIIEIETVFKEFSQANPVADTDINDIKTGMQVEFKGNSTRATAPGNVQTSYSGNRQEEFDSEEERYLKTMTEATNMNCPQKLSKDQTLEKVELTDEAMIYYYTYDKKAYKLYSKEKTIQKCIKELTKIYREEIRKERVVPLSKMLTALHKTGRYVEYIYYNPEHTEYFSYRINIKDLFNSR